jgi:hypothetical protein
MKTIKQLTLAVVVCLAGPAFSAMEILNLPASARPSGLAEACVALPGDVSAAQYNPALLGGLVENGFSVMYMDYIDDLNVGSLAASYNIKSAGVVGLGVKYISVPPFKKIDVLGENDGSLNASFLAGRVGFGRAFSPALSAGAALNVINDTYEDYSFLSGTVDLGAVYTLALGQTTLPVGLSVRNVGVNLSKKSGTKAPSAPLTVALGTSLSKTIDIHTIAIMLEGDYALSAPIRARVGAEYWFKNIIGIRGGYDYALQGPSVFKVGGGIRQPIFNLLQMRSERWQKLEIGIDYTFAPYSVFGDKAGFTHAISVSFIDRK